MNPFPTCIAELREAFAQGRIKFFGLEHARKDLPEGFAKKFKEGRFLQSIRTRQSIVELGFDDGAAMSIDTKINPQTQAPIDIVSFDGDRLTIEKAMMSGTKPARPTGEFAKYVYRIEVTGLTPNQAAQPVVDPVEAEPALAAPMV